MQSPNLVLTNRSIDKIEAPAMGKRLWLADTRCSYLFLRVTDRGIKTWVVQRWFRSRNTRITIGRYPEMSIEEARKLAIEISAEMSKGNDPRDKYKRKNIATVQDLFDYWLEHYGKKRCKTWRNYERMFTNYFSLWAERNTASIKTTEIQQWHAELKFKNGTYAANHSLDFLRLLFNRGNQWGLIQGPNPAIGIAKFKTKPRERFLHTDEMPHFLAAVEKIKSPYSRNAIKMMLLVPSRKTNVLEMRWEFISFERMTWYIPETKNGDSQTYPLPPEAIEILKELRALNSTGSPWVFPSCRSVTGRLMNIDKAWTRVKKFSGIHDIIKHDLRRTNASWQLAAGVPLEVIQKTLNHRDIRSTMVYARLNLASVRSAIETAVQAIMSHKQAG